jgi:hypothetical protein
MGEKRKKNNITRKMKNRRMETRKRKIERTVKKMIGSKFEGGYF